MQGLELDMIAEQPSGICEICQTKTMQLLDESRQRVTELEQALSGLRSDYELNNRRANAYQQALEQIAGMKNLYTTAGSIARKALGRGMMETARHKQNRLSDWKEQGNGMIDKCDACNVDSYTEQDTCRICRQNDIIARLKQQLQQASRDATEEAAKAHRHGWEQAKLEATRLAIVKVTSYDVADAIAAMEYNHGRSAHGVVAKIVC